MRYTFAHFFVAFLSGAIASAAARAYIELLMEDSEFGIVAGAPLSRSVRLKRRSDQSSRTDISKRERVLAARKNPPRDRGHRPTRHVADSALHAPSVATKSAHFDHQSEHLTLKTVGEKINTQPLHAGNVKLGERVQIAPTALIRAEDDERIWIGDDSRVLTGAILLGATKNRAQHAPARHVAVNEGRYAVFIGENVTLSEHCQVHGPTMIESDVTVGRHAIVQDCWIHEHAVIEEGAIVANVVIPAYRLVPAGRIIRNQGEADHLPRATDGRSVEFPSVTRTPQHRPAYEPGSVH